MLFRRTEEYVQFFKYENVADLSVSSSYELYQVCRLSIGADGVSTEVELRLQVIEVDQEDRGALLQVLHTISDKVTVQIKVVLL